MTKEKDWELVRERERFLIKEIIPSRLFQYLVGILSDDDKEQVQADESNHGHRHATGTLIDRLKRRGENAFPAFVIALRKAGYPNTALLLDPKSESEYIARLYILPRSLLTKLEFPPTGLGLGLRKFLHS